MTTPNPRRMNWQAIADLEARGDAAALATALRNIITLTDDATHAAQAAATAWQEYVPTVVYKDDVYRAMDTALRGEPYEVRMPSLATFDDEAAAYEPTTDNKALARAIEYAHDMWGQYEDSDGFDPATDYCSWIADAVQSWLSADEKARAKPAEVRGPAADVARLAGQA